MVQTLAAVGALQRDLQRELTYAGLRAAQAKGSKGGRRPAVAAAKTDDVRTAYLEGRSIAASHATTASDLFLMLTRQAVLSLRVDIRSRAVTAARRRGHATAILRAALPVARGLGINRALVTCDPDNVPSRKVIEACGGAFEDQRGGKLRFWITVDDTVARAAERGL